MGQLSLFEQTNLLFFHVSKNTHINKGINFVHPSWHSKMSKLVEFVLFLWLAVTWTWCWFVCFSDIFAHFLFVANTLFSLVVVQKDISIGFSDMLVIVTVRIAPVRNILHQHCFPNKIAHQLWLLVWNYLWLGAKYKWICLFLFDRQSAHFPFLIANNQLTNSNCCETS